MRLAWFVTPHGFGHAARTAAILEEVFERFREIEVELWSWLPEWFWRDALRGRYRLRAFPVDVGIVQRSPVAEDPWATFQCLENWWLREVKPRWGELMRALERSRVQAVVADIAPLGVELAHAVGLPALLVENFTWDWIYEGFVEQVPGLRVWMERFRRSVELADRHWAIEPYGPPKQNPSIEVLPPIARRLRSSREAVRARLGVAPGQALVVVSFGGISAPPPPTSKTCSGQSVFAVVGSVPTERWEGMFRFLPHRCPIYHPDLLHAADLWVGKPGYSSVVELARAGTRALLVPRPGFPESEFLERWLQETVPVGRLEVNSLYDGSWVETALAWLEKPPGRPREISGASEAARRLLRWLEEL